MRPELVHDLFAVEAMVRCEREQLDQRRGLPEPPLASIDGSSAHHYRKTAEQLHANGLAFAAESFVPS
jgi:hypothetical protein